MKRLSAIGFVKVGEWDFKDQAFKHTISDHLNQKNILYAFACGDEPLYIGKTTNTLRNRMTGYKNASSSQKTNVRVKDRILELLNSEKRVDIYVFLDDAKLNYKGYNLCLASALEDTLISQIQPKWNDRGIKK